MGAFALILTTLFVVCKVFALGTTANWPWLLVFSPLIAYVALGLLVLFIFALITALSK